MANLKEIPELRIVEYDPQFKEAFRSLNEEWISKFFRMEKTDYDSLDDPEGYIIGKGGHILITLYKGEPVGVCALIKMQDDKYDFELAKMAVSPSVHGMGIGHHIGLSCIDLAAKLGAEWLYLESNTILEPAINLYRKLGFKEVTGRQTPYERCNIQMELRINY